MMMVYQYNDGHDSYTRQVDALGSARGGGGGGGSEDLCARRVLAELLIQMSALREPAQEPLPPQRQPQSHQARHQARRPLPTDPTDPTGPSTSARSEGQSGTAAGAGVIGGVAPPVAPMLSPPMPRAAARTAKRRTPAMPPRVTVIAATNRICDLDPALLRRFRFEFSRVRMWRRSGHTAVAALRRGR